MQASTTSLSRFPVSARLLSARLSRGAMSALIAGVLAAGSAAADTPPAAQWAPLQTGNAPQARHENGMAVVDGRLFLLGGRGERALQIFDPAQKRWRTAAAPPMELHHMQAVGHEGRVYVLGALTGDWPEETPVANVLIYDPAADRWETGAEIPAERRRGAAGLVVHEGRFYLVGGNTRGHMSGYVPWLDVFDPASGRWTALADAPNARDHFHAVVVDGRIVAAGGRLSAHDEGSSFERTVTAVDVYDIEAGSWTTLAAPLPTGRAGTATVVVDGRVLVIGGESMRQKEAHAEVEALDLASGRWEAWAPLPRGRHGTQAGIVDGDVHIVAGSGNRGGGPELDDHLVLER